jgi:hypothetical protein
MFHWPEKEIQTMHTPSVSEKAYDAIFKNDY